VAGPLTSDGLTISYFSSSGAATTVPSLVKTIVITFRGETEHAVNQGLSSAVSIVNDTLSIRVQLRNAR
jgi:hypothetical protein